MAVPRARPPPSPDVNINLDELRMTGDHQWKGKAVISMENAVLLDGKWKGNTFIMTYNDDPTYVKYLMSRSAKLTSTSLIAFVEFVAKYENYHAKLLESIEEDDDEEIAEMTRRLQEARLSKQKSASEKVPAPSPNVVQESSAKDKENYVASGTRPPVIDASLLQYPLYRRNLITYLKQNTFKGVLERELVFRVIRSLPESLQTFVGDRVMKDPTLTLLINMLGFTYQIDQEEGGQ